MLLAEPQVLRRHLALNPREATDANNLIREVLGSDPEHRKALLFYGEVMIDRQNVAEAMPIYLKLVAASMGEDQAIKKPLAHLLAMPGAVALVEEKLPPANKAGADIYGYLGGLAKDVSELAVGTRLYRTAISMDGRRATYLLNHMHTLELSWAYEEALSDAVAWLRAKVSAQSGARVGEVTLASVLEAVTQGQSGYECVLDPGVQVEGSPERAAMGFADPAGISTENESQVGADGLKAGSKRSDQLDREGLDLLAVCFTLCKICYVGGQLALLPPLIRLIEAEHRERDLHKTLIKNEA